MTVGPVNDAPVVDLNGAAGGIDFAASFTEGGGPVAIAAGTATVSDVDSGTLDSLTVSITNVQDVGLESLTAVASGSVVVAGNGTAALTLSGGASLAEYQTVLQSITYDNTSLTPTAGVRTIEVRGDDGAAANNLSSIPPVGAD